MIDSLLVSAVKVSTSRGGTPLTNASGFFFQRDERLFLVTSRHVIFDSPSVHFPDMLRINLHTDRRNIAEAVDFEIPLYRNSGSLWRQGVDSAGGIDIAVIEIEHDALPRDLFLRAFSVDDLLGQQRVEIGTPLLIVGFPLGFHDTLHQLPVARQAIVSSCFDLRFQGQGYFLTDGRTHRGMSGAPVVLRAKSGAHSDAEFPWILVGVHSSRLDVGTREAHIDEALGLNCTWFADILLTLTERARVPVRSVSASGRH